MITKSELEKKYGHIQPENQNKQNQNQNQFINRQKAIVITPKSLKQQFDDSLLANSSKSSDDFARTDVYKGTQLDSKLQSILNSNGKSVDAVVVDKSYNPNRQQSLNKSFHVSGTQTPKVEYNQNYERVMKMQKQPENQTLSQIPQNKFDSDNIYNQSGATSFYSMSSYSNPQTSLRVPSSEQVNNEDFSQQKPIFKQPLPINKDESLLRSKQINLLQSYQKIQTIDQLANLKEIVKQKKINEHIKQYQIPQKKIKQEENSINQNITNLNFQNQNTSSLTAKNSQGLNTAEKSVLYKPEYYQKVGLPMPDSVAKQKKLEREIEQLKENVKPQLNDNKSQWLTQNFRKGDLENRIVNQKQINNDLNNHKESLKNQINQNQSQNQIQGKQILGYKAAAEEKNQNIQPQNQKFQTNSENQKTDFNNNNNFKNQNNISKNLSFIPQEPKIFYNQNNYPLQKAENNSFKVGFNQNPSQQISNNKEIKNQSLNSQNFKQESQVNQNVFRQLLNIKQNQNQQVLQDDQKDLFMNQVKDVILMLIEKEQNKQKQQEFKVDQNHEQKSEVQNTQNVNKQQNFLEFNQQPRAATNQLYDNNKLVKQNKNEIKIQEKFIYRNDQLLQKIEESNKIKINQNKQNKVSESIKIQQNFQIQQQLPSNILNNNNQILNLAHSNQQYINQNNIINQQLPQVQKTQFLNQNINQQNLSINNQIPNHQMNKNQINNYQINPQLSQHFKKQDIVQQQQQQQSQQNIVQNEENILDLLNPKHLLQTSQNVDPRKNFQQIQNQKIQIQNNDQQNNNQLIQPLQQQQQLQVPLEKQQIVSSNTQVQVFDQKQNLPNYISCSLTSGRGQETLAEIKKAQIEFKQTQVQSLQKRMLSQHEKKVLYIVWIKKNLQDFNYWIQKSKSILDFNFIEDKGSFKCEAKLNIPMNGIKCLSTIGLGANKKESKKNAMEQLAIHVILNDQIFWVGITGRQYLESVLLEFNSIVNTQEGQIILKQIKQYTNFTDDDEPIKSSDQRMEIEQENQQAIQSQNNSNEQNIENNNQNINSNSNIQSQNNNNQAKLKNQQQKLSKKEKKQQNKQSPSSSDGKDADRLSDDLSGGKNKLKVQKYLKRIYSCLQEDKIIEALEKLALVGSLKNELKYRDYCYIWNYAVQSRNLTVLKICLDVIHYRKMSSQMTETIQFQSSADTVKQLFNPQLQNEQLTQINFTLQKFVSTQRVPIVNNQFEQFNTNVSYLVDDEWFTMRENPSAHFFSLNQQFQHQSFISQAEVQSIYQKIDFENFSVENNLETVQHLKFKFGKNRHQKSANKSQEKSSSSNKQKLYMSAGKKKTILSGVGGSGQKEDIDLRNASFVRSSALFFKNDINQQKISNFNMPQQSQVIRKDPYLQYLSWEDLNYMYQSLLYIDDPIFALQACELLYSQTKIDQDLLINGSLNYFVNKKVILYEDFFEGLLAKINKSNSLQKVNGQEQQNQLLLQQQQQQLSTVYRKGEKFICQGFIQYLGSNYEFDQFNFRVLGENGEILPQGNFQIQEGDLCVLQPKNLPQLQSYSTMGNQNTRYIILIKELGEENAVQNNSPQGQNTQKYMSSANSTYQTFKFSIVLTNCKSRSKLIADYSQVYNLYKIASTSSLREKSKSLDSMCTKVSMLHSIFNSIVLCNNGQQQLSISESIIQNKSSPDLLNQREDLMKQSTIVATEVNLQEIAMENNLNQDQVDALYSGSVNSLTLIQGVKHTGRFRVAVSIIQEWLIQSNLKILVKCDTDHKARQFYNSLVSMQQGTQSNSSSESSCKFLKNSALQANICLVLDDTSIEFFNSSSRQFMTSKMSAKVKRSIDESKIIILGSSSLHSSNNQSNILNYIYQTNNLNNTCQQQSAFSALRDCSFNRVIFYNSEQIQESSTWEYLVKNCNQCVMIGDLTAFQRDQTRNLFTKSRFGDRSVFENLIQSGFKPIVLRKRYLYKKPVIHNQRWVTQNQTISINTQNIANLHNSLFFDNQLILFNNDTNSPAQINSQEIQDQESSEILIIALKGKEEVSNPTCSRTISDTGSIYNTDEIYMILAIVNNLVNVQRVDLSQIRVITPTIAQKTQLQIISSQKIKIVVNAQTIQEPLNQTYEYVLFSAVKSNDREDIGIARNPSILSSMLQHATQKFIFIGDIDLYSIDPTWSELFYKAFIKKQVKFYHQYQKLTKNLSKIFDFDSEEKEQGEL